MNLKYYFGILIAFHLQSCHWSSLQYEKEREKQEEYQSRIRQREAEEKMRNESFEKLLSQYTKGEPKSVKIGTQIWMAENLNVDHFRNGDSIPEAKTSDEWEKVGDEGRPAWCYYDNEFANGNKYGKLYNFLCCYRQERISS